MIQNPKFLEKWTPLSRMLALVLLCFATAPADAFESDFALDGSFLVEAHDEVGKKVSLQIWHIELLRGLPDGKQPFTDFSLVVTHLSPSGEQNSYSANDIEIHQYIPDSEFNSLLFANNSFIFEFGALRKLNVKIDFNKDGTLANISGSLLNKTNPTNVTTFKLLKDPKQVHILQKNTFSTNDYSYRPRK